MKIMLDENNLSDKSLRLLDQISCFETNEGYWHVLCHIDIELKNCPIEKRIFLVALKEENPKFYKRYVEEKEKREREIADADHRRMVEQNRKQKEKEKAWAKALTEEVMTKKVQEINPNFCGVIFRDDRRFYKKVDFYEAILSAFHNMAGGHNLSIAYSCFLDFLRNIRPDTNICMTDSNFYSTDFFLCFSPESRDRFIKKTEEKAKEKIAEAKKDGYISIEGA